MGDWEICDSDVLVKDGVWLQYPRVPGHEIAGRIDAVGDNVKAWTVGQRVGAATLRANAQRKSQVPCSFRDVMVLGLYRRHIVFPEGWPRKETRTTTLSWIIGGHGGPRGQRG